MTALLSPTTTPTILATESRTATVTVTGLPPPPPPGAVQPLQPYDALSPLNASSNAEGILLNVPFRSQYDAGPYQLANCGPSALAMVLQAYGLDVSNARLRAIANELQGSSGYSDGVALDYLQAIAQQAGLRTEGLIGADGHYRKWSMSDVIHEIRRGYPVITLVHFAALPAHASSSSTADHYIVIVGVTTTGFVINDPGSVGAEGYHLALRPDQLIAAWNAAGIQDQAVAFLPPTAQLVPFGNNTDTLPSPPKNAASLAPVATRTPTASLAAPALIAAAAGGPPATALPPPPEPAMVTWSDRVRAWQHASPVPTVQVRISSSIDSGASAVVLAEHDTNLPSPLPTLLVVGLIGALGLAIARAPRGDDKAIRRY